MLLAKLLDGQNRPLFLETSGIMDKIRSKSLDTLITDIINSIDGLKGGDVDQLKTDLAALQTTVSVFLTGEDDNNETLDRLSELVAAIKANKDSIDALVSDKATKEALDAVIADVTALQGKAHEHANLAVLEGISRDEATGNLVFNGKQLDGKTGIAFGATAAEATDFTGEIKIVIEEIDTGTPAE